MRRTQSNGYVERLHRTLLDEHFRVMGRTMFFEGIMRCRPTWTAYLVTCKSNRPHQGRNINGRTPAAVFVAGLPKGKNGKEETKSKAT